MQQNAQGIEVPLPTLLGRYDPFNVAYRESQVIQRDIQSRPEPSESFDGRAI